MGKMCLLLVVCGAKKAAARITRGAVVNYYCNKENCSEKRVLETYGHERWLHRWNGWDANSLRGRVEEYREPSMTALTVLRTRFSPPSVSFAVMSATCAPTKVWMPRSCRLNVPGLARCLANTVTLLETSSIWALCSRAPVPVNEIIDWGRFIWWFVEWFTGLSWINMEQSKERSRFTSTCCNPCIVKIRKAMGRRGNMNCWCLTGDSIDLIWMMSKKNIKFCDKINKNKRLQYIYKWSCIWLYILKMCGSVEWII